MLKGAHAVILALFDFAKGVSSGHADTMLWLMWGGLPCIDHKAPGGCKELKHSAHASTVLLAVCKRRISSRP